MVRTVATSVASALLMLAASQTWAQTTTPLPGYGIPPAPTIAGTPVCPRPAPGSTVLPPPDFFSHNGLLSVQINYNTRVDTSVTPNRTLFCFQEATTGYEGPTLRINPGDTLSLNVTNNVPASGTVVETVSTTVEQCGSLIRTPETLNIHYHGAPVSPACGQDQVIHTMIDSGQS
ncbi:MAG TPA: hypothetical protein VKT49_03070, partial [Bryobacteraceae bacterium]|nr:hypothetical protein [Bryobacteraceae bacterium]